MGGRGGYRERMHHYNPHVIHPTITNWQEWKTIWGMLQVFSLWLTTGPLFSSFKALGNAMWPSCHSALWTHQVHHTHYHLSSGKQCISFCMAGSRSKSSWLLGALHVLSGPPMTHIQKCQISTVQWSCHLGSNVNKQLHQGTDCFMHALCPAYTSEDG